MKKFNLFYLLIIAGAIFLSSFSYAATPSFYTDRSTFESDLDTIITDDYSPSSGYPSGFAIYNNVQMSSFFGETDYQTTGFPDWNFILSSETYCAGCNGSFLLSFTTTSVTESGTGVFGVGVDILSNASTVPYFAYITYGDATTETRSLPTGSSFFGVTAPELIQSIHFGLSGGGSTTSGSFEIDNLTIGNQQDTLEADLSVSKSDDPDPVVAGQTLTYTITVSNAGPSDAANVVATDTLPSGVTFVSTTGCADDPNGVPTCNLGMIAAGENKQYTVTVTVNTGTSGVITNNVSVTSDATDPTPGNNNISEDTTVNAPLPVPMMSERGMIIFILFAGLGALFLLRRQRKAER